MNADPVKFWIREADQESQSRENLYQETCKKDTELRKQADFEDILLALEGADALFRKSLDDAAKQVMTAERPDLAELGRIVHAVLEKHIWNRACDKTGFLG